MQFTEILDQYKIPYKQAGEHHHCSAGWIGLDCPYCSRDSQRFRLGYNLYKRYLFCWTCGYHHLLKTLCEVTGERWDTIQNALGSLQTLPEPLRRQTGRLRLPNGTGPLLSAHKIYLKSRGFNPKEIVNKWKVQGIGLSVNLAWHLVVPIQSKNSTVSWTARALSNCMHRYTSAKTSEETISHKSLLYNEDFATHSIIVVEGITDVWRIGDGAVATFGTSWTRSQLLRMSQYPKRAVCFDSEPDAQKRARRLVEALEVFPGTTYLVLIDAADPGSASPKEIKKLRKAFLGD